MFKKPYGEKPVLAKIKHIEIMKKILAGIIHPRMKGMSMQATLNKQQLFEQAPQCKEKLTQAQNALGKYVTYLKSIYDNYSKNKPTPENKPGINIRAARLNRQTMSRPSFGEGMLGMEVLSDLSDEKISTLNREDIVTILTNSYKYYSKIEEIFRDMIGHYNEKIANSTQEENNEQLMSFLNKTTIFIGNFGMQKTTMEHNALEMFPLLNLFDDKTGSEGNLSILLFDLRYNFSIFNDILQKVLQHSSTLVEHYKIYIKNVEQKEDANMLRSCDEFANLCLTTIKTQQPTNDPKNLSVNFTLQIIEPAKELISTLENMQNSLCLNETELLKKQPNWPMTKDGFVPNRWLHGLINRSYHDLYYPEEEKVALLEILKNATDIEVIKWSSQYDDRNFLERKAPHKLSELISGFITLINENKFPEGLFSAEQLTQLKFIKILWDILASLNVLLGSIAKKLINDDPKREDLEPVFDMYKLLIDDAIKPTSAFLDHKNTEDWELMKTLFAPTHLEELDRRIRELYEHLEGAKFAVDHITSILTPPKPTEPIEPPSTPQRKGFFMGISRR